MDYSVAVCTPEWDADLIPSLLLLLYCIKLAQWVCKKFLRERERETERVGERVRLIKWDLAVRGRGIHRGSRAGGWGKTEDCGGRPADLRPTEAPGGEGEEDGGGGRCAQG